MIILLLAVLFFAVPSIVFNSVSSDEVGSGVKGFLISVSWKYKKVPGWINVIFAVSLYFICVTSSFYKIHIYKFQTKRNLTNNPSNFTLLIKDIPKDTDFDSLKNAIENEFRVEEVPGSIQENQPSMINIVDVSYGYKIDGFVDKCLEIYRGKNNNEVRLREKFESLINDYNQENLNFKKNGFVLLTLNTVNQKAKVKTHFKLKTKDTAFRNLSRNIFCQVCFKPKNPLGKNYIRLRSAPDPFDIIWHKLSGSIAQRFCKKFTTYLFGLIITIICSSLVYLMLMFFGDSDEYVVPGLAISFIVIICNNITSLILQHFTRREHHFSYTVMTISLMRKIFIFTTLNTAISMYIIFAFDIMSGRLKDDNSNFQIISTIWLFSEAILNSLFSLCNPLYLKKLIQRNQLLSNRILKEQNRFNHIFTNPRFNISDESAKYLRILFIAIAFSPLNPLGLIIAFFPIIIFYITDKYLFLRRSSRSSRLNEKFSQQVLNIIKSYFFIIEVIFI